jgi:CheY-like chemotaxis protein
LKFSEPITCVRVSLEVNEASVTLSCTDTGKGVASDFLQYAIFDPFSQEDPATEGTGLGLSIVKETTTMLGGAIRVDSSGDQGSTFTATFPSSQLVLELSEEASGASGLPSGTAELPELEMSLFAPSRRTTGDTVRDQRCAEMLSASLTRSLSRWFQVQLTPWASMSTSAYPRLLFTLEEDTEDARQNCGDAFDNTKHVVLCPDVQTTLSPYKTPSEKATIIAGPVTISKLQDALALLFPERVSPSGFHTFPDQSSTAMGEEEGFIKVGEDINEESTDDALSSTLAVSLSNLGLEGKQQNHVEDDLPPGEGMSKAIPCASPNMVYRDTTDDVQLNNGASPAQTKDPTEAEHSTPSSTITAEPKILLVDDNTVNLKVLNMYVRKCTSIPSTSASGGQEAIDAFNNAVAPKEEGQASQPFDLIFLDLSMPQVSGFDVARQIRETEARLKCERTYICALTGLVSRKDRNAAYASGVDNYLVRPAKLKDLQDVVEMWRNSQ